MIRCALVLAATCMTALVSQELSPDERQILKTELNAWKASAAGEEAVKNGLVPPASHLEQLDDIEAVETFELLRFRETKHIVDALNQKHPTARFSTNNPFALMTSDEFAAYVASSVGGLKPNNINHQPRHPSSSSLRTTEDSIDVLNTTVDYTTSGCLNPIQYQGRCGSCWAFAALKAAESQHCLVTGGTLLDLSEQQVTSCDTSWFFGNMGCYGGFPWTALDYIAKTGVALEDAYPYISGQTNDTESCVKDAVKVPLRIGRAVRISGERALQDALTSQPVVVTVSAGNDVWKNYVSGIIPGDACSWARSDHAVVAVGFGADENGVPYYKIANSWSTKWGDAGYIYVERGVGGAGTCNAVSAATYPAKA